VTCDEARELIGADPEGTSPELLSHLAKCPACETYREQMLALNAKLRQALELDWHKIQPAAPPSAAAPATRSTAQAPGRPAALPPAVRSNVTPFRRRTRAAVAKHPRPGLFAFAASVAAALVVALTLWLSRPPESLAAEVVTHVKGEPNSWYQTQPVEGDRLDAVLRKSGVKLGQGMQPVVYASSCWFRGHFVPHFVVMTKNGPVTVMILLKEKVPAAQQFNEEGYSGLLVPARTGSVAVLSRAPMALEQPASDVVKALQAVN
jgi:Protein of unknown function (DUF3379)